MIFNDKNHTYFNEVYVEYTSISKLLGEYKPKKDWDLIAQNYADKGLDYVMKGFARNWEIRKKQAYERWGDEFDGTGEFVRKIWGLKSKSSLESGTFYHNYKEILDSKKENTNYNPLNADGEKHSIDLDNLEDNITYLELMCYSHLYSLCGQADKVNFFSNKLFDVRDMKTSKTIDFESIPFYNKKLNRKVKEKYISPISHITTNNYMTYCLQLSCYAYMLEMYGYKCNKLWIDHVVWEYRNKVKKKDLIIGEEPEFNRYKVYVRTDSYEATYLKEEVKALFKDFKNKQLFEVTR